MAIVTGATMTHVFEVPIDLTAAEVCFVTYQQMGKTVVEKTKEDCMITPEDITVEFSQEDTLAFAENVGVRIQIRARFADGSAVKSEVVKTTADELLKEGVI